MKIVKTARFARLPIKALGESNKFIKAKIAV